MIIIKFSKYPFSKKLEKAYVYTPSSAKYDEILYFIICVKLKERFLSAR